MKFEDYPINVSPIPADEGGGYMAFTPDLSDYIADQSTINETIAKVGDAFEAWVITGQQGAIIKA